MMEKSIPERITGDPCAGCTSRTRPGDASRRAFVRDSAAAIAAFLTAGAVTPARLAGLPVRLATGSMRRDTIAYPVPAEDGVTIDREHELILVRWQDRLYAFALSCPHQRSMLKWREQEQRFQCTKHKSKYTPEGAYVSGRATRGMDRYSLRTAGGRVHVDVSRKIEQDVDEAAWSAAAADLS